MADHPYGHPPDPPYAEQNTVGRLLIQKSTLEVDVKDLARKCEALRTEEAQAQDRLGTLRRQHTADAQTARAEITKVRTEHEQVKAAHTVLLASLAKARSDLGETHEAQAAADAELGGLRQVAATIDDRRAELTRIQQSIDLQHETLTEVLQAIEAAKGERAKLAEQIAGAEAHVARKHEDLNARVQELDSRAVTVDQAEATMTQHRNELATLEAQLARADAEAKAIEKDLQAREAALVAEKAAAAELTQQQAQERQVLDKLAEDARVSRQDASQRAAEHEARVRAHQEREKALQATAGDLATRQQAIVETEHLLADKTAVLLKREKGLQDASLAMADAQARVKRLIVQHGLQAAGIAVPPLPGE